MEITMNIPTPIASTSVPSASGFGMPNGGQSCFGVFADVRNQWIPATGLSIQTTATELRDRKDLAAKGHVALVAYVPGYLAWSPPIC